MPGKDAITVEGTVVEALHSGRYRVELPNRHRILAYVSGKLQLKFLNIATGDRVTVVISPFDLSKGRITLKDEK